MKKIYTILVLAGVLIGCNVQAYAIDFKVKGQWVMSFDYGQGMSGYSHSRSQGAVYGSGYGDEDEFEARQRLRLQLSAIASESLSGTVYFEIGDTIWGRAGNTNSEGGALGTDGVAVKVKAAYIDWIVPETQMRVRMGLQGLSLPSYPSGSSQVFDDDVAAIVLSNTFNDMFSLTAFWARPYNDNFDGYEQDAHGREISANFLDNVDVFGLLLPMTFEGMQMTPWVMYSAIGQNFARSYDGSDAYSMGNAFDNVYTGLFPVGMQANFINGSYNNDLSAYGSVFNMGFTGEITYLDPWHFAFDFNYGDATYGEDSLQRQGWYASLLMEYKMHWGTPGLYGWYSSGDDGDISNGSERMPTMDVNNGDNTFSNFASSGTPYIARSNIIGETLIGTWGVGARLRDFTFLENLKHTLRINYFEGTNAPEMAQYMRGTKPAPLGTAFSPSANKDAAFDTAAGIYMTSKDSAMEVGFTTEYNIYDNMQIVLDTAYLALWLDSDNDVWGKGFTATDAWNVNATFVYSF